MLHLDTAGVRAIFEMHGFLIQEWDKVRTDWLTIRETSSDHAEVARA